MTNDDVFCDSRGSWSRQGKHGRLTDPMAVRQSIQNISKAFIEVHRQSRAD